MPITLKGIRLESLTAERDDKTGNLALKSASYSLLSSADKVLAQQTIGGYNNLAITPSAETLKALEAFLSLYKRDITAVLGLEEA
jgi:hypothetical protein